MNKKVEPYLYLKSHSISLMDVNFKIIQCYLSLGANAFDSTEKSVENLINYCKNIFYVLRNYQLKVSSSIFTLMQHPIK